jgi:antitoxin component of RelBE/YafQ-DinJ toxin-antitoxin module
MAEETKVAPTEEDPLAEYTPDAFDDEDDDDEDDYVEEPQDDDDDDDDDEGIDPIEDPQEEPSQEQPQEEAPEEGEEEKKSEGEAQLIPIKVDGKDVALTLEQLKILAQKSAGSDKKFAEAAAYRKKTGELLEDLKSRPMEVLQKLGLDVKKLSEEFLTPIYKRELMPEEERKVFDLEDENQRLKRQQEEAEKAAKSRVNQAQAAAYRQQLDKEIPTELSKVDMPRNPNTVMRVIKYLMDGNDKGLEIPVSKAVALAKEDYEEERVKFLKELSPTDLAKYVGEDKLKELKKQELVKIKSPQDKNRVTKAVRPKSKKAPKGRYWEDIQKELDELEESDDWD